MSDKTPIEWCDSTVNPTMGCDGCELWNEKVKVCYAGVLHEMRGGNPGYAATFKEVTTFPGRMAKTRKWSDLTGKERPDKPWLNGMPRLIFVSDMSDALSNAVSFEYLEREVICEVTGAPHQYLWLTKRPQRMAEFAEFLARRSWKWPDNLWAGTSITDQPTADVRLKWLRKVPAKIRFVSAEPLLANVSLPLTRAVPIIDDEYGDQHEYYEVRDGIHWVIVGFESGSKEKARNGHVEHAWSILRQCEEANVKCFIKQLGTNPVKGLSAVMPEADITDEDADPADIAAWEHNRHNAPMHLKNKKGGDWNEWRDGLRVREFPKL
jgi:protein gp37